MFSLYCCCWFFFFKQKTAYEMRISDWSSDVCSSDRPPALVDAVVEVEEFQVLELQPRGREQLFADADMVVHRPAHVEEHQHLEDRNSVVSGKSVSVSLDLGGRRIIKKKT